MSKKFFRLRFWCVIGTLAIAFQACGATQAAVNTSTAAVSQVAVVSSPTASPSPVRATAAPSATSIASPTATTAPILVTATKGNVFIRRGPDLAFNPLSLLRDGQSARALARDVLGGWVQIPFPGQPEKTGWISVHTQYITVSGDLMSLPEIEPTDWPVPASLLNCTHDEMLVDPGGIIVPSVDNFPDNDVNVDPGTYVVRDAELDCQYAFAPGQGGRCEYPVILTADLREGSAIIIGTDGQKKNCTVPNETINPRCAKAPGHRLPDDCPTTH